MTNPEGTDYSLMASLAYLARSLSHYLSLDLTKILFVKQNWIYIISYVATSSSHFLDTCLPMKTLFFLWFYQKNYLLQDRNIWNINLKT